MQQIITGSCAGVLSYYQKTKGGSSVDRLFNDNVNVPSRIEVNNVNDNVKYSNKYEKSKKVDMIADQLVGIFNNPNARRYYCKVAAKLPESVIFNNVEQTKQKGVTDPAKLFTFLCQRVMN